MFNLLRRSSLFVFVVAACLAGTAPVHAQDPDTTQLQAEPSGIAELAEGRGTAAIIGWPDVSLDQLLDEMGRRAPRLLPEIDSLFLDYGYVAGDSTSDWSFELTWRPGDRVLDRGEVTSWSRAPSDVRMVSVELLADVVVNGERVAEMIVAVDSMALRPSPSAYTFDVTVGHDRVFLDAPPEAARRYLQQGIALENLVVERMGFTSFGGTTTGDARGAEQRGQEPRAEPRRQPVPPPSIYEPRTTILIGWRIGPTPYYVAPRRDAGRAERPRGENVGAPSSRGNAQTRGRIARADASRRDADRGESSADGQGDGADRTAARGDRGGDRRDGERRRGEASGDKDGGRSSGTSRGQEDDDDDEDDPSLAVPALGAVAAVGLFAYVGGTVGLSGTGETPLGLTAGYTHEKGGVQLQASVNESVIEQTDGQLLTVKALGFYDVFASRVQPALGLGAQVDADGGATAEPSVSAGLVGNFGRFVLYGGFDAIQRTPELSLAYNFRHDRGKNGDDVIAER